MSSSIPYVEKGNPIKDEHHNKLVDEVNALRLNRTERFNGHASNFRVRPPFAPFALQNQGGQWSVRIQAGYIIETNIQHDVPPMKVWTPKVDGQDIDLKTKPEPRLDIANGDKIYLTFETDSKGKIKAEPKVEVKESPQTQHHIPSGDYAQEGKYAIQLFEVKSGSGAPVIENTRLTDNYYWNNQLVALHSLGDGADVYSSFNKTENRHELRSIKGKDSSTAVTGDYPSITRGLNLTATVNGGVVEVSGTVDTQDVSIDNSSDVSVLSSASYSSSSRVLSVNKKNIKTLKGVLNEGPEAPFASIDLSIPDSSAYSLISDLQTINGNLSWKTADYKTENGILKKTNEVTEVVLGALNNLVSVECRNPSSATVTDSNGDTHIENSVQQVFILASGAEIVSPCRVLVASGGTTTIPQGP